MSLGIDYRPVKKAFAWKSLTKNKGKAHIYQDVLVMGSIYVIKYRFYEDLGEIWGTLGVSQLVFFPGPRQYPVPSTRYLGDQNGAPRTDSPTEPVEPPGQF